MGECALLLLFGKSRRTPFSRGPYSLIVTFSPPRSATTLSPVSPFSPKRQSTKSPSSMPARFIESPSARRMKYLYPGFIFDFSMGIYSSRSEEHTSELQSQFHLVCRLLL